MLMPKKNRTAIYEFLFKEGVMVAKNDFNASKHPDLESVPNLHVIKTMQSLKSRGFVREQFAWQHFYWYLTNEGIEHLRMLLHLPPEIVPTTLKRNVRPTEVRSAWTSPRDHSKPSGDRINYRRADRESTDKEGEIGAGTADMKFRGGFGRGRGGPLT